MDGKDRLIEELRATVAKQAARLEAQVARITELELALAKAKSDETSIKDNGKKCWIGCITAATFTLFHIAASRSRDVLEKLVGPEFASYLNLDYFSASLGARNRTQAVKSQVLSITEAEEVE